MAKAGSPPSRRRRSLLADHDFRWLWSGQSVAEFGAAISAVVLPLVAIDRLNASASAVGVLVAALWVPGLVIGLHAGVWVGRRAQRSVMLRAHLGRVLLLASVPLAAVLDALTYGQLIGVAIGVGTLTVLFDVAYQSFLPAVLPAERLVEGNSTLQVSAASARVVGPGAGGWMAQLLGAPLALLGEVAAFLAAAAALSRTRARGRPTLPPLPARGAIREGLAFTFGEPTLRTVTVVAAAINLSLGGYEALVIIFLRRTVGMAPGTIGLLLAIAGGAAVVAAAASGPLARRCGTARVLIGAVLLIVILGPLTALAGPKLAGAAVFALGACGLLTGVTWFNIIVRAFRQSYCEPNMLTRLTASMRFVLLGTMPLGALVGGILGQWIGPRGALTAMLLANLLPATVLLASPLRRLRDLPVKPTDHV